MDIGVKLRVTFKNHNLVKLREGMGFYKIQELLDEIENKLFERIPYQKYLSIENLRQKPSVTIIYLLCEFFGVDEKEIFPEISETIIKKLQKRREAYKIFELNKIEFNSGDTDFGLLRYEAKDAVNEMIEVLTDREKKIIKLRYYNQLTYQEAGKKMNITRERVRQIEEVALAKMRGYSRPNDNIEIRKTIMKNKKLIEEIKDFIH